jgi:hypothetical protein
MSGWVHVGLDGLTSHMCNNVDFNTKDVYFKQISNHKRQDTTTFLLNEYFIDYMKDGTGNLITPDHSLYSLSEVIGQFKSGQKYFCKNSSSSIEKFFDEKGPHFSAGYVSKFRAHQLASGFENIGRQFSKLIHRKSYSSALKVLSTYRENNKSN